jgi:hypothetical protein
VWSYYLGWRQRTRWRGFRDVLSGIYQIPPFIQAVDLAGERNGVLKSESRFAAVWAN